MENIFGSAVCWVVPKAAARFGDSVGLPGLPIFVLTVMISYRKRI